MDVLLVVLGIIAHELSHSVVAGAFGVRTRAILLGIPPEGRLLATIRGVEIHLGRYPAGFGVDLIDSDFDRITPTKRVLSILAGPASNLALTPFFFVLGFPMAAWTTLALGLMNCLPFPPLDGGNALCFARSTPKATRERIAAATTNALNKITVIVLVGGVALIAGSYSLLALVRLVRAA
jgi:membrane-associated protease RseP (regulator of RpoE activity)